jgi:hypothetical protein
MPNPSHSSQFYHPYNSSTVVVVVVVVGLKMAKLWAETCRRSSVFYQHLICCVWLCTTTNIIKNTIVWTM